MTGPVRPWGTDLELFNGSEFVAAPDFGAMVLVGTGVDGIGITAKLGATDGGTRAGSPGEMEAGGNVGHLNFCSTRTRETPEV